MRRLLFIALSAYVLIACEEDEALPPVVVEITVKTQPKNTYMDGELLDLSGLVVTLKKSDSATINVPFADFTANGITTSPPNGTVMEGDNFSIIITHTESGKSAEQFIAIGTVSTITITTPPTEVEYFTGEALDLTGLTLTLHLDNSLTRTVSLSEFESYGIETTPADGSPVTPEISEVIIRHSRSTKEVSQPISIVDLSATDVDGNTYGVVKIGAQFWLSENLKTLHYQNGDEIGTTTPADLNILNEATPKYQWAYNGDEEDVATYGRLYTQFVAYDERNICPNGWRIPSQQDYQDLQQYLIANGFNWDGSTSGNKLGKSIASKLYWDAIDFEEGAPGQNPEDNNTSGFNGLGSGTRLGNLIEINDEITAFVGRNVYTYWWSSNSNDEGLGVAFRIQNFMIEADIVTVGDINTGAPCRCIKN